MTTRSLLDKICESPGQPGYDLPWNKYRVVFTGLDDKIRVRYANVRRSAKPKEQAVRQVVAQHCRDMGEQDSQKIGGILQQYLGGRAGQLSVDPVEVEIPRQSKPKGQLAKELLVQQDLNL
jgi:hypothetical protein